MRKSTKVVVLSLLTIAMCVSIIAGSTFALFTSESSTNIAVSSGKVQITAAVDEDSIAKSSALSEAYVQTSYADGKLSLTNMVPGDKVELDIDIVNHSTVASKWQLYITANYTEDNAKLYNALQFTLSGELTAGELGELVKMQHATATRWHDLAAAANVEGESIGKLHVSIELPVDNKDAQNMECSFDIMVKAVQGNAHTADPVEGATAFNIESADDIAVLRQNIADGKEYTTIALLSDVTLDDKWVALDSADHQFTGEFVGNGYTITYTQHTFDTQAELKAQGLFVGAANAHDVSLRYAAAGELGIVSRWDGSSALTYVWQVNDLGGLRAFRDSVNSNVNGTVWAKNQHPYVNETVEQTADIDLLGEPWIRIGVNGNYTKFAGTFNGNGYVFRNVVIGKEDGGVVADETYTFGDVFNTLSAAKAPINNTITSTAVLNYSVANGTNLEQRFVWEGFTTNHTTVVKENYIVNVDGFKEFRDNVNKGIDYKGETIFLETSVDVSAEDWAPIGTSTTPFRGIFDGKGNTVTYKIGSSSAPHEVTASDRAFGLFGYVVGSVNAENGDAIITHLATKGDIVLTGAAMRRGTALVFDAANYCVGGVVAEGTTCTISRCTNGVNIDLSRITSTDFTMSVGGIYGVASNSLSELNTYITDCVNNGNITATAIPGFAGHMFIGGISGFGGITLSTSPHPQAILKRVVNCGKLPFEVAVDVDYSDTSGAIANGIYVGHIAGLMYLFDPTEELNWYMPQDDGDSMGFDMYIIFIQQYLVMDKSTLETMKKQLMSEMGIGAWEEYSEELYEQKYAEAEGDSTKQFRLNMFHENYLNKVQVIKEYEDIIATHQYNFVNRVDLSKASSFAGLDFSTVWKMTSDGPALR